MINMARFQHLIDLYQFLPSNEHIINSSSNGAAFDNSAAFLASMSQSKDGPITVEQLKDQAYERAA